MRWLLGVLLLHTAVNARLLRTPVFRPLQVQTSVLLPVRDEAHRVEACLRALLTQDDNGLGEEDLRVMAACESRHRVRCARGSRAR